MPEQKHETAESLLGRSGRISRRALAKVLGVNPRAIDDWVRHGVKQKKSKVARRLPAFHVGQLVWFEWSEVYAWMRQVEIDKLGSETPRAEWPGERREMDPEARAILERNGYVGAGEASAT